jgi:hypothetical protein
MPHLFSSARKLVRDYSGKYVQSRRAQISFGKALYPTHDDSANRTASDQIAQGFSVDAKHARRFTGRDKHAVGEGCG